MRRLSIPAYNLWNGCLHGVGRVGVAAVFRQAIGLAFIRNPDLIYRIATAITDEALAK
jgi:beta-glucosidase